MTALELQNTLAINIKKYRKDKFTQESLAERIDVSQQEINGIEGCRRFPRADILAKIADALDVEVYQLFIPQNKTPIKIEETPENEKIRAQLKSNLLENIRKSLERTLDKIEKEV